MTETRTRQQMLDDANRMLHEYEERKRRGQEASRKAAEQLERVRVWDRLHAPIPDYGAGLRRLREEYDANVRAVLSDRDLSDEGRDRKLRDLNDAYRSASTKEAEAMRLVVENDLKALSAIARVNDEPQDEVRYARKEREFLRQVDAGRIPDLESYRKAVDSGDRDLIRVFEQYALLYVRDNARRDELNAEIEKNQDARLTDEQRQARQKVAEIERRHTNVEMGLRLGFGRGGGRVA